MQTAPTHPGPSWHKQGWRNHLKQHWCWKDTAEMSKASDRRARTPRKSWTLLLSDVKHSERCVTLLTALAELHGVFKKSNIGYHFCFCFCPPHLKDETIIPPHANGEVGGWGGGGGVGERGIREVEGGGGGLLHIFFSTVPLLLCSFTSSEGWDTLLMGQTRRGRWWWRSGGWKRLSRIWTPKSLDPNTLPKTLANATPLT